MRAEKPSEQKSNLPEKTDAVYNHIALSLARGYTDLYYVHAKSGDYIEFHTDPESGVLTEARRGKDIFEACKEEVKPFVHPDDHEYFLSVMNREFLREALKKDGVYDLVYRRIIDGDPFYVNMKISWMESDDNYLVLAVADIDEQMKQRKAEEKMIEERIVYARLHALTGNFIVVYVVDPETDEYREFSSTATYEEDLAQAKSGTDFFNTVREAAKEFNYPDDLELFLNAFTKENVMREVEKSGIFTLSYRFIMEGKPVHVQLKAAMVEEKEGPRLVVGLNDVDIQVRQEEETARRLNEAQTRANIDALTGVKNKHAYLESETMMDRKIKEHRQDPFSVTICDVNDLKHVNDTEGHQAGDEYIKRACQIICETFAHSPVFRTGGDEFAVISQGGDYDQIEDLIWKISSHNSDAARNGGVVIACGMSKFANDSCVAEVFERADQDMYENKNELKTISAEILASKDRFNGKEDADVSRYDYLTGLLTMSAFLERAEEGKDDLIDRGESPMMLYMDFAGMKFVNTNHGFEEGDRVLKEFALMLIRTFGRNNCCRIGADHFAVVSDEPGLEHKLDRLFRDYADACDGKTPPVHVGIYPDRIECVNASTACDRAKLACNTLKGTYSSAFAYYDEKLREEALRKQYAIENFDKAIEKGWLQVYLQPIVRSVNEEICDVEALARWNDPEKGLLSPAEFIPALEEAGLIYKLDLCMLEQVLDFINEQLDQGLSIVPCSINLSRSDFDSCDIVEEIRQRVDAAGVDRHSIVVEITESIVGSNFEFIKEQVARFQSLGFPVWMDDFGSGYSSLDVLQSIKFDLIKFDLSFMRKFNEGDDTKVVLTELMRMATSLGVDSLCEGVETEEQVRFLQEIGCSKFQGYFYSKPLPLDEIRYKREHGMVISAENPEETGYYESISRVNLYDLGVIAHEDKNSVQNTFDTLPMGIIEIKGDSTRWMRSNQSYRDFIKRFFGFELSRLGTEFVPYDVDFMKHIVETCVEHEERSFFDERMADGSIVHSFAKLIDKNPVNGSAAVVVAVLSITESDDATSYADIARALAADFYDIYLIDLKEDTYIEYTSLVGGEELALERHGTSFFESAKHDALTQVDERDLPFFLENFTLENVLAELDRQGAYAITYRLVDSGKPVYVNTKITRLDDHRLILGVNIIDAQMKEREEAERIRQERVALARIAALSEDFIVLYAIDVATGNYTQYNPSREFAKFGLDSHGEDFFGDVVIDAPKAIPEEDMERHLKMMSEENVMGELRKNGVFIYEYRILTEDGGTAPTRLKARLMEEDGEEKIILGVTQNVENSE